MSTTAKCSAPLPNDFVVELLSEHGKRRALIGWGADVGAAHECYDATLKQYPHTRVRMRQGKQTIALHVPSAYVHEQQGQRWKH
jgi:hypothetical protein